MKTFFTLMFISLSLSSYAHNEDKLGPNKGFIQMPGTYHTEIVPTDAKRFNIYLLDINIKNPLTKNSSVNLIHQASNGTKTSFDCAKTTDHFECVSNKEINITSGKFIINSQRNGIKGRVAEYPLPLKVKDLNSNKPSTHHDMGHM